MLWEPRAGRSVGRAKLSVTVAVVFAVAGAGAPSAEAARYCGRVVNPYPNTRYEGEDLTRVLARNVTCPGARRVARGAHRKALSMTPPPSGVRRFTWRRWRVRGDLRGPRDHYLAVRGHRRVRWQF